MKAFLLAAGRGTRLKPYTDRHPKCLIPIHGTPLLKIWIDLLARSGISEVLINTHHHADQVERFVAGARSSTSITIHTVHEPELLGSAGTLRHNKRFVADQSDFFIAYADNLTNLDLLKMIDNHRHFRSMGGVLTMGLMKAPNPKACGIVTLDDDNKIIKFVANGGIYIASNDLLDIMQKSGEVNSAKVWDLGHHVLPLLTDKMYGFHIAPYYLKDIGTPEAYKEALNQWPLWNKHKESI